MKTIFRWTGSLVVSLVMFALFAFLMGWGTFIEREFGTPAAHWLIWSAWWFHGLMALLTFNVLSAMLARLPWKKSHLPFLMAHVGIILLLIGCVLTMKNGIEAKITISEGTAKHEAIRPSAWQFEMVFDHNGKQESEQPVTETVPFSHGPFNASDYNFPEWKKHVMNQEQTEVTGIARLARWIHDLHLRAVWGLAQLVRPEPNPIVYDQSDLKLQVLDYYIHADFLKANPLKVTLLDKPGKQGVEPKPEQLELAFPDDGLPSEDSVSARAVRKTLESGLAVTFRLAETVAEQSAFLTATPDFKRMNRQAKSTDNRNNLPDTQLVLVWNKEVFRYNAATLRDLFRYGDPAVLLPLVKNQENELKLRIEKEKKYIADTKANKKDAKDTSADSPIKPQVTVDEKTLGELARQLHDLQSELYRNTKNEDVDNNPKLLELRNRQLYLARIYRLEKASDSSDELIKKLNDLLADTQGTLKELSSTPTATALGQTGCRIVGFSLVPTRLPNSKIEGISAFVTLESQDKKRESLRLHSDRAEANDIATSFGVAGTLWSQTDESDSSNTPLKYPSRPRLDFLQTPDGKLFRRYWNGRDTVFADSIQVGQTANISDSVPGIIGVKVDSFEPNDEPGHRLQPVAFNKEKANEFYALVRVQATLPDGRTETFLMRTVPRDAMTEEQVKWFTKEFKLADQTIRISLTNPVVALGLDIFVHRFNASYEPGSSTPSGFASLVDFIPVSKDSTTEKRENVTIRMNRPGVFDDPVRHQTFWAYQDSFRGPFYPGSPEFDQVAAGKLLPGETVPRQEICQTVLSLNNDPGRGLKYLGSLLIALGTALLIYRKKSIFPTTVLTPKSMTTSLFMFLALLFSGSVIEANEPEDANDSVKISVPSHRYDWTPWCRLPVFYEGRIMPLDTFARQKVRELCAQPNTFSLDTELVKRLERPVPINLPSFDEFVANGKYEKEETDKLKSWYNEVVARTLLEQKRIAIRLKVMFPNGTRVFSPAQMLFSWLVEPEVWDYIPFLADPNGIISRELLAKNVPTGEHRRIAPIELDECGKYGSRLEVMMKAETQRFDSETEAQNSRDLDSAVAEMEHRYSTWRALTVDPNRSLSAVTAWRFDSILYPESGNAPGDAMPLIEKLNQSAAVLSRLLNSEKEDAKLSPFSDPEFILVKRTTVETSGQKQDVLLLMKQIHQISVMMNRFPLEMNSTLLARLCSGVHTALDRVTKHRNEIFRDVRFSDAYRQELSKTVRLTEMLAMRLDAALLGLTDSGKYSVSHRGSVMPIVPQTDGGKTQFLSRPATDLVFESNGTMNIMPFLWRPVFSDREKNVEPWISLQSVLFMNDFVYLRFLNPNLTVVENTKPKMEDSDPMATVRERLGTRVAAYGKQRPEAKAFYRAIQAWIDPGQTQHEEFNRAMSEFVTAIEHLAESTRESRRALLSEEIQSSQREALLWSKIDYPQPGSTDAEILYNRLNAFYWMWFFCLIAVGLLTVSIMSDLCRNTKIQRTGRVFFFAGLMALLVSCAITLTGCLLRSWITGWAPVTNMFETVVLLAFFISLFSIGHVLQPLFGPPVAFAWNLAGYHCIRTNTNDEQHERRVSKLLFIPHVILTLLTVWVTLWLCYREHGSFHGGILKAFLDSFAMQGILDQIAVTVTMLLSVIYIPRFVTAILAIILFPRFIFSRKDKYETNDNDSRPTVYERILQRKIYLFAGAVFALAVGMAAFYNTSQFNPNIRPLAAVLRSNFWLTVHVIAIMISYAMGTIAWGISIIMLGYYLFGHYPKPEASTANNVPEDPALCRRLSPVVLGLFRNVALFLTIGILLGARWADFSWGRFWSWDPKEVWALVTLFIYLFVLHARHVKNTGPFGLALGSVLGAFAIIMTWYGLSFVFGGGGRHAYVSGESGKTIVLYLLVTANIVWAVAASIRYAWVKRGSCQPVSDSQSDLKK